MMKALRKGHNYKRWAKEGPSHDTPFSFCDLRSVGLSPCAFREGPSQLIGSVTHLLPHRDSLHWIGKPCTYSGLGRRSKARLPSFLSPFPLIISLLLTSHCTSTIWNPGEMPWKILMHVEAQHVTRNSVLLTFRERWETGFEARDRVSS